MPRTLQTIAVDFDGVIHAYTRGYQDGSIYDEPIKGAFETIGKLIDQGFAVYVLSTRKPRQMRKWLRDHVITYDPFVPAGVDEKIKIYGFEVEIVPRRAKFWNKPGVLGVTNRKIPAIAYLDDRAVFFGGDWDKAYADLTEFSKHRIPIKKGGA